MTSKQTYHRGNRGWWYKSRVYLQSPREEGGGYLHVVQWWVKGGGPNFCFHTSELKTWEVQHVCSAAFNYRDLKTKVTTPEHTAAGRRRYPECTARSTIMKADGCTSPGTNENTGLKHACQHRRTTFTTLESLILKIISKNNIYTCCLWLLGNRSGPGLTGGSGRKSSSALMHVSNKNKLCPESIRLLTTMKSQYFRIKSTDMMNLE